MRLRLTFRLPLPNTRIPLAYNQIVSTHLAEWLGVSPASLPGLQDAATAQSGRLSDQAEAHFVFSRLAVKSKLVDLRNATIKVLSPTALLYLGIPARSDDGSRVSQQLEGRELILGIEGQPLVCEKAEQLPLPAWSGDMTFRMLSPVALPAPGGGWRTADDPELSDEVRRILLERYRCLYVEEPLDDDTLVTAVDPSYVGQRGGGEGVLKRVRLTNRSDGSLFEVRGFICPMSLRGNPRLIALAYDSGIGAMGTLGFGMMA